MYFFFVTFIVNPNELSHFVAINQYFFTVVCSKDPKSRHPSIQFFRHVGTEPMLFWPYQYCCQLICLLVSFRHV